MVGGVNIQETPRLFLAHWWVKPVSWVSGGLLVSQVLESGYRVQGSPSWFQINGGWKLFLKQLAMVSGLSRRMCWPTSGQVQVQASSRTGIGLLVGPSLYAMGL